MGETLLKFEAALRSAWESYSTAASGDSMSLYVGAERGGPVRVCVLAQNCSSAFKLTPDAARLLAAELIAAADSAATVAEAA